MVTPEDVPVPKSNLLHYALPDAVLGLTDVTRRTSPDQLTTSEGGLTPV